MKPQITSPQTSGEQITNSIGMRLVRIEPGTFEMGKEEGTLLPKELGVLTHRGDFFSSQYPTDGDFDEVPRHEVTISQPYYMGTHQVTNAQYEQFDPAHRELRGRRGFSTGDDEAVVFVSWEDAVRFCQWLSEKEGRPYRLPTEAEWEYACRAGTTTPFYTGETLPEVYHKHNVIPKWGGPAWYPGGDTLDEEKIKAAVVPLTVGQTPPNPWGLYDMHGNVEEWCLDWYGPYALDHQTDPVGSVDGDFRVTRGGSHTTALFYLRSSNRAATLPEDRNWMIGFRVVLGPMPATEPLPVPPPPLNQQNVRQNPPADLTEGPDPSTPYFVGPRRYVKIPADAHGPLWPNHNHDPNIIACANGDLLAAWYTCIDEPGRENATIASRLRYGQDKWETASVLWDAPDRNEHSVGLLVADDGTIHHFSGLSIAASWGAQALLMRTSHDHGATWSKARLINPIHGPGFGRKSHNMVVESLFQSRDGTLVIPSDASDRSTVLHLSDDGGETWREAAGSIAGIHAGVVELEDGRLLALGRGQNVDGHMPMSISDDMGETWTVTASPFPGIGSGQRLTLKRLHEGPILFASFAGDTSVHSGDRVRSRQNGEPITVVDAAGKQRQVSGMFVALSYDEGKTWPVRKLVTAGGPPRELDVTYGESFTMDANTGEPQGYLAACQGPDGVIHLISSQREYAFNLAWIEAPMPPESE